MRGKALVAGCFSQRDAVDAAAVGANVDFVVPNLAAADIGVNVPCDAMRAVCATGNLSSRISPRQKA